MSEILLLKNIIQLFSFDLVLFFYNLKPTSAEYLKRPIKPYLHQIDLFSRLQLVRPIRVLIADEIGLGKTIEAASILRYLEVREEIRKVLILTPKILVNQWIDELRRAGVSYFDIEEIKRANIGNFARGNLKACYFVVSIDFAKRQEYREVINKVEWDAVVVDEAHNVGYNTQRWHLVRELVCGEKGRKRHLLFLSATPHRGNILDYLYRLYFIDPSLPEGKIKSKELDRRDFYILTHNSILYRRTKELVNEVEGKKIFTNCNFYALAVQPTEDEMEFSHLLVNFLQDKVSSIYDEEGPSPEALLAALVRKRASSSPDAALKTFTHILQGLSERIREKEAALKKAVLFEEETKSILGIDYGEMEDIEEDLDEVVEKVVKSCANVLSKSDERLIKTLIELANRIKLDDSKLSAVTKIVDSFLGEGQKVIIFTEYRDTLEYLKLRFEKLAEKYGQGFFETISGKDKDRFQDVREKFEGENCNLLIATDVVSEGLNLQVANILINYEAPWSPIKLEQRMGRVWRLGQKEDVNIYTTFMGTNTDVDIMQNLYAKIMAMKDALSEVKPLLGEKVQIAYRATATASEDFWKTRGVEFTEVEVEGKKEKVNEFKLILASLKGTLSRYVESLICLLSKINRELLTKSIYPYVRAEDIKRNLLKRISAVSTEKYDYYSRKLCEITCKKLGVERYKQEICGTGNLQKIWELIKSELKKVEGKLETKIFFSSAIKPSNIYHLFLVEVKQNKTPVFEEPILYDKSEGKIIYGVNLLGYLTEIFNSLLIPYPAETGDHQFSLGIELGEKARIERKCKERYVDSIEGIREYLLRRPQYKSGKMDTHVFEHIIDLKDIAIFIGAEEEPETIPDDVKKKVENAAMKLVMQIEEKEGRKPDDSPAKENKHYDIYSYDPETGEERFIEVKGHAGMQVFAELTREEFKFGKNKGDKYWLYIVFNLTTAGDLASAKYLRFKDATNTMSVRVKDNARYVLTPKS